MKDLVAVKEDLNRKVKDKVKMHLSGFFRVLVVGLLVLLQFAIIFILSMFLTQYSVYFYLILELMSIAVIITLINDSRSPSYKIAWICIALVLPATGHIMYALWGKAGSKKKIENNIQNKMRHGNEFLVRDAAAKERLEDTYPELLRLSNYMDSQSFPLFQNNDIRYYPMGEDVFEAIYEELRNARHFVLINFFIVGEGKVWDTIHEILREKIRDGVEVKFLYDDFGAMLRTERDFKKNLEAEGFEIRIFNPIHKYMDKLYMNYRSHQKVVVVDGNVAFTGGINIADEYANIIHRFGTWKDNGVRVTGDAVWGFTVLFLQMWEVSGDGPLISYLPYRPTANFPANETFCHFISDGPSNNPNNPIESVYKQMMQYSHRFLYITTPYLVIENDVRDSLITAAKSGVDVRIIIPNIPDKRYVKILTNYHSGELLRNGVRIFEYTPGFIHAKTILNETCGIVGTINMDYRSFYLHYECGLWMCNNTVLKEIKKDLDETMQISQEMTYEAWKKRPLYLRLIQPLLNLFSTLM